MVVKEKRGRRRYVLFKVSPCLDKDTLIRKANRICNGEDAPYVIQCDHGMAIIRCPPEEKTHIIEIMSCIDSDCSSITTSGTLKTLRDAYPDLRTKSKKR